MIKVGLYSITYLGVWYKGGHLTIKEMIQRAKKFGYEGIEIDLKRPHGFPLDLDKKARAEIKNIAESEGIEIPIVASNNNFSSPVAEQRENELLMVHEQIRLAKDLGAKYLRLFAAWPGVTTRNGIATYDVVRGNQSTQLWESIKLERWNYAKECFKEAAKWAEEYGVVLALQNHRPLIENYEDMLDMIEEVDSDYFKGIMDVTGEPIQEDAYMIEAQKKTGKLHVASHFGGEFCRNSDGKLVVKHQASVPAWNYPASIKALKEIGFDGYVSYEFCHAALKNHEVQGIEYVDQQVEYAIEYMKDLIQNA